MNGAAPSSSQSSQQPAARIFVNRHGQPLHVFVEASSVHRRPKLIRTLKSSGAVISHSPGTAQIILVDPHTEAGVTFAKDWGSEPGKVVLNSIWVRDALQKGAPAFEEQNWGGYRVHADGSTDNQDTEHQSPLPTPRQTPVESQADANTVAQQGPSSYQGSSNQYANAFPPTQMNLMNPAPRMDTPPFSQPAQGYTAPMNGTMLPQQAYIDQPMQNFAQLTVPANMVATLLDVMRHQQASQVNPQAWPPQMASQMPMGLIAGQFTTPGFSQPGPLPQQMPVLSSSPPAAVGMPYAETSTMGSYAHTSPEAPSSPTSCRSAPRPSQKRKFSPFHSPTAVSKAKQRAPASDRPRKARRRDDSVESESSSSNSPLANSLPLPPASSSYNDGQLFTDEAGEAMSFVVQIDIRNRKDIVNAIKKHGGKITSEITQADYVVLTQTSSSFQDLLKTALAADKPAVQGSFVHDCVRKGMILDEEKYSFEGVETRKRRGRQPPSRTVALQQIKDGLGSKNRSKWTGISDGQKRTPKVKENKFEPVQATPSKGSKTQTMPTSKAKSKARSSSSEPDRQTSPSPPPPPVNIVSMSEGKNYFTQEDKDYFSRYVLHIIKHEPDISYYKMAIKLHAKMPHHPTNSWNAFVGRNREDVEAIRKKVFIALRKGQPPPSSSNGARFAAAPDQVEISSTLEPPSRTSSSIPQPPEVHAPVLDRNDRSFRAIVDFFVDGGADDRTDAEVWKELSKMHPYWSARQWEDYWQVHGEVINQEVQLRISQNRAIQASFQPKAEPAA